MAKILTGLPDSARTIVYEMVVAALKADVTLSATIAAPQWTTYLEADGSNRNTAIEANAYPAIHLLPFGMGASSETQVRQDAPFGIAATITTAGHDIRDILNLWGAVEAALFTGDGGKALNNGIRAALATAGQARGRFVGSMSTIRLLSPAIAPSMDSNGSKFMTAAGSILVELQVPK